MSVLFFISNRTICTTSFCLQVISSSIMPSARESKSLQCLNDRKNGVSSIHIKQDTFLEESYRKWRPIWCDLTGYHINSINMNPMYVKVWELQHNASEPYQLEWSSTKLCSTGASHKLSPSKHHIFSSISR